MITFKTNKYTLLLLVAYVCVTPTNAKEKHKKEGNEYYILIDQETGRILKEKNSHTKHSPASLTKILTSYIINKKIKEGEVKSDEEVSVLNAWKKFTKSDSSKMFVEPRKKATVDQLLHGIIVSSGNDACLAMAEHIATTEDKFADIMNKEAKRIGMYESHFVNSHGLYHKEQYTTAYDLAILTRHLISEFPEKYKIYSDKSFTYNNIKQYNRNSLLWDKKINVDGVKTGHTSKSKYNIVNSAKQENVRLISVILNSETNRSRTALSKKLLSNGFKEYKKIKIFDKNEEIHRKRIWFGETKNIIIQANKEIEILLSKKELKKIKHKIEIQDIIEAPVNKNQVLGKIIFTVDDEILGEYKLVAQSQINKGNFFQIAKDYIIKFKNKIIEMLFR